MGKQNSPTKKRSYYGRAARRRQRSKRKYTLYYFLALILMFCIGIALSLTVFFKIVTIEITGIERYAKGELIETAQIKPGENLFRIDAQATSEKLIQKYPYIAQVRVQRVLPDAVYLHIKEAQPKAVIENEDGFLILDEQGRVLETGIPILPEGYFRVIGFEAEGLSAGDYLPIQELDKFRLLMTLEDCIKTNGLSNISLIDVSSLIDIRLLYDGRVVIELGGSMDIDYKIRAAKSVVDLSVTPQTVGLLDVSSRPAMRLREVNIYDPAVWPFENSLLEDYERVVIKQQWQSDLENPTDSTDGAESRSG